MVLNVAFQRILLGVGAEDVGVFHTSISHLIYMVIAIVLSATILRFALGSMMIS